MSYFVSSDQFWTMTTARRVGKSLRIKRASIQYFYVDDVKD